MHYSIVRVLLVLSTHLQHMVNVYVLVTLNLVWQIPLMVMMDQIELLFSNRLINTLHVLSLLQCHSLGQDWHAGSPIPNQG